MRSFTFAILSAFTLQVHVWAYPAVAPAYNLPAVRVPMPLESRQMRAPQFQQFDAKLADAPPLVDMQSQQGNAPVIEYVYSGTPYSSALKKVARPKGSKAGSAETIKDGRTPGADSFTTEAEETTSGRFGLDAKAPPSRTGYTGGVAYGPKRGTRVRPASYQPMLSEWEDMMSPVEAGPNAPVLDYVAYPAQTPVKKLIRPKDATRRQLNSMQNGRTPGADSYNAEEEEASTYGRFGLDAKQVQDRTGYTGGVVYGPKKAASSGAFRGAALVESRTSSDITSIPAMALMALLVGSGFTFAVQRFRLASSTVVQEPFLLG